MPPLAIETSYLLQKMDEYDGVVILASNLRQNLDDAFTRRLRFIVEFPFPEAESRRRIWRTVFPSDAPLSADVDFTELAERFPISGGNNKNIALNAAFLTAGRSRLTLIFRTRTPRPHPLPPLLPPDVGQRWQSRSTIRRQSVDSASG